MNKQRWDSPGRMEGNYHSEAGGSEYNNENAFEK